MSGIEKLFDDCKELVEKAAKVLRNSALRQLVASIAKLGNIGEELNSMLDALKEVFGTIAKGLEALIEPLRQAVASLALVELLAPLAGQLGGALAVFGESLVSLGMSAPPTGSFSKTLGDVQGVLEKVGPWVGKVLPKPEDLQDLARAFRDDLGAALDSLRPPTPQTA